MNLEELAARVAALRTTASAARPALAAALHHLAVAQAQAGDLAAAVAAGREAVILRAGLAGAGEATAHELASSLGNLSNMLIDVGQVNEVAPLWEHVQGRLRGSQIAAPLAVYWARYQLTHGWPSSGLRLATTVAMDPQAGTATIAEARALVRTYATHRPAMLAESLRGWLAQTPWTASQTYLTSHPELLATDVPALLDSPDPPNDLDPPDALAGPARLNPATLAIHRALLILATGSPGLTRAYRCLTEPATIDEVLATALREADPLVLQAAGAIEVLVHHRTLAGSVHALAGQLLADGPGRHGPPDELPDELANGLAALADGTSVEERDRIAADLETLLATTGRASLTTLRQLVTNRHRPESCGDAGAGLATMPRS